jgi:hypothetical protein
VITSQNPVFRCAAYGLRVATAHWGIGQEVTNMFSKSFYGAALGTMVEYYDYALFAIFLPILAPLFFPADTIYHSLNHLASLPQIYKLKTSNIY